VRGGVLLCVGEGEVVGRGDAVGAMVGNAEGVVVVVNEAGPQPASNGMRRAMRRWQLENQNIFLSLR
jgi:hypothetical protein